MVKTKTSYYDLDFFLLVIDRCHAILVMIISLSNFIDIAIFQVPPLLIVAYFWILGKFIQELREIVHQASKK